MEGLGDVVERGKRVVKSGFSIVVKSEERKVEWIGLGVVLWGRNGILDGSGVMWGREMGNEGEEMGGVFEWE